MKLLSKLIFTINVHKGRKIAKRFEAVTKEAAAVNQNLLLDLIQRNAETEYGQKYDFANIHSLSDYQAKVPFSTYDDYAAMVDRTVKDNESGLMTVDSVVHYALTSGSVDNPKKIPVTEATIQHYREYMSQYSFALIDQKLAGKWKKGRGLNLVEIKFETLPNGCYAGSISGRGAYSIKNILHLMFTSPQEITFPKETMDAKYLHLRFALPERELSFIISAFMTSISDLMKYLEMNWEMLVEDIERGTINPEIKISPELRQALEERLRPDPARAAELKAAFQQGFAEPIIPRIWPEFAFVFAIGSGSFSVYTDKMRSYLGSIPIYFSAYAASESLMAICDDIEKQEFVLIPDSAFFEFIPLETDAEAGEAVAANLPKTLTMEQLEVGKDYEIVLTNRSGFYRYRIKDVVRVLGWHNQAPKIKFVYRLNQMVSIAGEKTTEESVAWAVTEFAKAVGCQLVDYSVYADTTVSPGRYVVFVETEKPLSLCRLEEYRQVIEAKLSTANPSIGSKIASGVLGLTDIKFVQAETYALYRDMMMMRGISGNQIKPVRVFDTPVKEKFFFALIEKE
jgi:hypothetical protein